MGLMRQPNIAAHSMKRVSLQPMIHMVQRCEESDQAVRMINETMTPPDQMMGAKIPVFSIYQDSFESFG